jgi:NADH:ubiquinone reductase (non-electrogenic)
MMEGCGNASLPSLVNLTLITCASYRFDKRITEFAEDKFGRDGIDVKTGYKVVKVAKDAITMQNPATGDIAVPYGMAVWSTGIGTRPFISEFMKQIGQVPSKKLSSTLCS